MKSSRVMWTGAALTAVAGTAAAAGWAATRPAHGTTARSDYPLAGQTVIDLLSDDDRAVLPEELLDGDDDRAAVIALTRVAEAGFLRANYACQYLDWVDHGYGILDVTRKRVVAEFWWQDKRTPDSAEILGQQLVVWGEEDTSVDPPRFPHQIDPVTHHGFVVRPTPRTDL